MGTVTSFSYTAFAHRRREQHEAPAPSCIVLYNSSSTAFYSLDFYVILSAGWRDAEVRIFYLCPVIFPINTCLYSSRRPGLGSWSGGYRRGV